MIYSVKYPIIWESTSSAAGYFPYAIIDVAASEIIFAGNTYITADGVSINVSPIIQDYLNGLESIPAVSSTLITTTSLTRVARQFALYGAVVNNGVVNPIMLLDSWTITYDYSDNMSYDDNYDASDQIDFTINDNQLLFFNSRRNPTLAVFQGYSVSVVGDTSTTSSTSYLGNSFGVINPSATGITNIRTVNVVRAGVTTTYTVDGCNRRYILYYVNKKGGVDFLRIKGNAKRSGTNTVVDIRKNFDRRVASEFEQSREYIQTQYKWVLNTGWLTDEQSSKMDNLFTSPRVWLHDTEEGTIKSVLIADTSFEIKQFKIDRKINYAINVNESQIDIRR